MITHVIYHAPERRKVGCTRDIEARRGWYSRGTVIEVLEELHDATDREAGDREWHWADKLGYPRRKHYVDAISMGQSEGSRLTLSSDELSDLNKRSALKISPERRIERAKKMGAGSVRGLTPDQLLTRVRKANAAMQAKRVKCPYCEFEGNIASAKRWHFDKCPNKSE